MLFRNKKSDVFEQNISLTELEEMLPFERSAYIILMMNRVEEEQGKKGNS